MAGGEDRRNDELIAAVTSALAPLVAQLSEANRELLDAINDVKSNQQLTNERLSRVATLADSHEHILRGNGRVGILTRIDGIEKDVSDLKDRQASLKDGQEEIITILRGEDDKPGLIHRLKQVEDKAKGIAEGISKPAWIVIGAALSAGVGLIIELIFK